jgi:hypothetical protein
MRHAAMPQRYRRWRSNGRAGTKTRKPSLLLVQRGSQQQICRTIARACRPRDRHAGGRALCTSAIVSVLLPGAGRGGQRERAALGVLARGPTIARVDDRAAELADALDRRRQVGDGELGKARRVAGPGPRRWTPRCRPSVSVSHPDPAAVGRGARVTPRTPCQNWRARSGSSAGNSISGAGMDGVWPASRSLLLCATCSGRRRAIRAGATG